MYRAKPVFFSLILIFGACLLQAQVLALMPPEVYRRQIEESSIKVLARVIDVRTIEITPTRIIKQVDFELIQSFGPVDPGKNFKGICYSAGKEPLLGGTIYYYPKAGEEVFVTLAVSKEQKQDNSNSATFTSFTIVTPELLAALKDKGLAGLEYGIGKVSPKK